MSNQSPFFSGPLKMRETVRNFLESALGAVARSSGLAALLRRARKHQVPILSYHSLADRADAHMSCLALAGMVLDRSRFRKQMEYVATHYRTLHLGEFARLCRERMPLPPNSCVITFDDGFLDADEIAVPILEELQLKATFFVIGRPLADGRPPWPHSLYELLDAAAPARCAAAFREAVPTLPSFAQESKAALRAWLRDHLEAHDAAARRDLLERVRKRLGNPANPGTVRYLNAEQVRDLRDRGYEIGCHSMDHEILSRLTSEQIDDDIRRCVEIIEGIIGQRPEIFCYPFGGWGTWDDRVVEALKRNGFACACTTERGLNDARTDPFALRRIVVRGGTSLSGFVAQLLGLHAPRRKVTRAWGQKGRTGC